MDVGVHNLLCKATRSSAWIFAALAATSAQCGSSCIPSYAQSASAAGSPYTSRAALLRWFNDYDDVRKKAQLSPADRDQADSLLGKGLAILTPGPDKDTARNLLDTMVSRYRLAASSLRSLPMLPETQLLHRGYYQYFNTAAGLFSDYLAVQSNLFATDGNGQPIMQGLLDRKTKLEQLNTFVHELDGKIRGQFNVPPYKY